MIRFYGTYEIKLDAKGRMALPSRFRSEFPENRLIITKGYEACLTIYPMDEFVKVFDQINQLSDFVVENRVFKRTIIPNSAELEFDSNGRILVPKTLLSLVGIDKDVKLLGVGRYIEMWDNGRLTPNVVPEEQMAAFAEKVMTPGKDSVNKES